jgi:hypothetical protein
VNLVPFSPENVGASFAEWMMDAPHQRLVYEFYDKILAEMPNGAESAQYKEGP